MQPLTDKELIAFNKRYKENPLLYLKEVLDVKQTWKLQDELINAIPIAIKEHKQIYVASGHALGKDHICSALSLWFLHSYIPSIVIQTAPTSRQVENIMWGDTLLHWRNKLMDLGGTPYTSPYLEIDKADWYLKGFTTKDSGASSNAGGGKFQGYHASNFMVVASEAQAIEDSIFDQIDAIATSENNLVIFIGNPTRAKGRFAAGLRDKKHNIVFNFSCLESPNYTEKRTVIPGMCSYEWVEDKRVKWGEDDPRWIGRVLGQIPDNAINNTFPLSLIQQMKGKYQMLCLHASNAGVAVDPAGEGIDENVFMSGNGGDVLNVFTKTNMSPSDSAHKAVEMCKQVNGHFIVVDCDGLGIGVYQELCKFDEHFLRDISIIKFHGSGKGKSKDGDREIYQNMRSEASFITQAQAKAGKASINQEDTELIEDLTEEEYFTNKRGLIQIEPKEDLKERLGRSPGRGDAYKMLQWGFAQNFKDERKYDWERNNGKPRYAVIDDDALMENSRLPRYSLAE